VPHGPAGADRRGRRGVLAAVGSRVNAAAASLGIGVRGRRRRAAAGGGPATPAAAVPDRAPAAAGTLAPTADYPAELAPYYTQALTWTPCEGSLTCTWLTVPLDYADPGGATIRIRAAKATATGPAAQRQGSIVINPGGPGGSGVGFTAYVAESIAADVATQFDFVGFDPRGVGQSAPITCLTGRQTAVWLATDGSPNSAAEERRLMSRAAAIWSAKPGSCGVSATPSAVSVTNSVSPFSTFRRASNSLGRITPTELPT